MKKTVRKWFKPVRGSYLPRTWQGWSLYAIFAAYMISAPFIVEKYTSSIMYIAIQVFAQWIVATVVMTWIAQRLS